jgi:hypothetical protein
MAAYKVSVKAPDLSTVLKTAERTGSNEGVNEFMSKMIDQKFKAEEARKDRKARVSEILLKNKTAPKSKTKTGTKSTKKPASKKVHDNARQKKVINQLNKLLGV